MSTLETGVDELVKVYLRSRGFQKAFEALTEETSSTAGNTIMEIDANTDSNQGVKAKYTNLSGVKVEKLLHHAAESLCLLGVKNGDVSSYCKEFDKLYSWTNQSIDACKPFLHAINFVLFVYCYIGIIRFGQLSLAQQFWQTYHHSFAIYFLPELNQLNLLQSNDQLNDEEFLQSHPFLYFLSQQELILLAAMINDKITFQKFVEDQMIIELESNRFVELEAYTPGYNEQIIANSNPLFHKVALGVPGTGELLQSWKEKSLLFREITIPDLRKEALYKVWIEKLIRPKAILKKILQNPPNSHGNHHNATITSGGSSGGLQSDVDEARKKLQKLSSSSSSPGGNKDAQSSSPMVIDGSKPSIPTSSTSMTIKDDPIDTTWTSIEVQPKSTSSHTKGNPLDPSIIFATISNCEESLTCLRMNSSVNQVCSGYRDSIVRVWRLDENLNDRYDDSQSYHSMFGRSLPHFRYALDEVLPKPKEAFTSEYIRNHSSTYLSQKNDTMDASSRHRYPMIEFKGHSGPIYSVDQNSEDRLILSSAADAQIRLWDTTVLQCVGKYVTSSIAWDIQFNPILDYYFASANQDTTVTVYATDRTIPIRMMTGHISDVNCVAWHGNNMLLASGSEDRTIRLWDIRTPQCNRLLKGSNAGITTMNIGSVGNMLAAGNEYGKIYLYDLRTSRILSILNGHEGAIYSLQFNEEMNTLVSGSQDCSVRIWDLLPAYDTSFTSSVNYQINTPIAVSINGSSNSNNTVPLIPHGSSSSGHHPGMMIPNSSSNSGGGGGVVVGGGGIPLPPSISGKSGSTGLMQHQFENYVTKVIKPKHSFFTKATPVFHVGYTSENLVYAAGPCSFITAANSREKYVLSGTATNENNSNRSTNNKTNSIPTHTTIPSMLSEHEAVTILGISAATTSN